MPGTCSLKALAPSSGMRSTSYVVPPPRRAEPLSAPDWPAGTLFVHTADEYWDRHDLGCNGRPRPLTLVTVTLGPESGNGGIRSGVVSRSDGRCNLWQFPVKLSNGITVMLSSRIARNASGGELRGGKTFELVGANLESGKDIEGTHGLPNGGKQTITLRAQVRHPSQRS